MQRSLLTIARYEEALGWVIRDVGDQPLMRLNVGHVLSLRRKVEQRGCGEARVAGILNALRSFLKFCREILGLSTLDPQHIRVSRIPQREVVYLNKEELDQFLESIIRSGERWETVVLPRLRFRALIEVLLGTGARISEVLALDRRDVDFQRREAKTIGKGNKQRVLFFTERALEWLRRYLSRRRDDEEALFVTRGDRPRRLAYDAVKSVFKHVTRRARSYSPACHGHHASFQWLPNWAYQGASRTRAARYNLPVLFGDRRAGRQGSASEILDIRMMGGGLGHQSGPSPRPANHLSAGRFSTTSAPLIIWQPGFSPMMKQRSASGAHRAGTIKRSHACPCSLQQIIVG